MSAVFHPGFEFKFFYLFFPFNKFSLYNTEVRLFIYSLQWEITQIISDHLSNEGHLCLTFDEQSHLYSTIKDLKKHPDLLILDFRVFNHDTFNIFSYFERFEIKLPVLFYNDPCLTRTTLAEHWKSQIDFLQGCYIDFDEEKYMPLFKSLQKLIESKEFKPYIALLQEPQPVPQEFIRDKYTLDYLQYNKDDSILNFKERNNLSNSLFYLLSILQKNKGISLSLKDIAELYKKDDKKITVESLRVLISKLKKAIRTDRDCNFLINKELNRYRFVKYKN